MQTNIGQALNARITTDVYYIQYIQYVHHNYSIVNKFTYSVGSKTTHSDYYISYFCLTEEFLYLYTIFGLTEKCVDIVCLVLLL